MPESNDRPCPERFAAAIIVSLISVAAYLGRSVIALFGSGGTLEGETEIKESLQWVSMYVHA